MAALIPPTNMSRSILTRACTKFSKKSIQNYRKVMQRQRTGFNSPCKLLERRWRQERFEKHRRQLNAVTPTVDTRAPRDYFHLHVKLKKLWLEEQRNSDIRRENARLLRSMDVIMRKGGWTESRNDYQSRSLNADKRRRDMLETMQENHRLLQRITQRTPVTISQEWRRYLQPAPRAGSCSPRSVALPRKLSSRSSNTSDSRGKYKGHGSDSASPLEDYSKTLAITMSELRLQTELPSSSTLQINVSAPSQQRKEDITRPEIVISKPLEQER